MLKKFWSILSNKCERSATRSNEKLVLCFSCQVHSFLCTHAWRVIRKIGKYTRASMPGVWAYSHCCPWCWIHGQVKNNHGNMSSFNIFSPLVTPEDQVMQTWGSGFSRITGLQYAKLVSSCKKTFFLWRLDIVFYYFTSFFQWKTDKNLKTSIEMWFIGW